ncbi:MAG TPA: hypothetical protein VHA74_02850 [Candidatus Dojkabacteria bacterium]|nr:hypothetical protein [Candidatus Dojkabacteria bacterium]
MNIFNQINKSEKGITRSNIYREIFDQISGAVFYADTDSKKLTELFETLRKDYRNDKGRFLQISGLYNALAKSRDLRQEETNEINNEFTKNRVFHEMALNNEGKRVSRDIYQTFRLLGYSQNQIREIVEDDRNPQNSNSYQLDCAQAWFDFLLDNKIRVDVHTEQPSQQEYFTEPLSV